MTNVLAGYLQSLGVDMYHASVQAASHSLIVVLPSIVIIGVIAGVGLIGYDFFLNRKKSPNIKELAKEVARQQEKEEIDQLDTDIPDGKEKNERDGKSFPSNFK